MNVVNPSIRAHLRAPVALKPTLLALVAAIGLPALLAGCSGAASTQSGRGDQPDGEPGEAGAQDPQKQSEDDFDAILDLPPITKSSMRGHPGAQAWVISATADAGSEPRKLDIGQAEARGYTVIDLSDDWRPYIFTHQTPGQQDLSNNAYAARYVELANDVTDSDGDPLDEGKHNYLELYGIPPTLSVVAKDWASAAEVGQCLEDAGWDPGAFGRFDGTIAYRKGYGAKRLRKAKALRAQLEKAMRKAKIPKEDLEAAKADSRTSRSYENWRALQSEVDVIANAQIRFRCERLFPGKDGTGKFKLGDYDSPTHHALADFEKKHDIMGWGHFKSDDLAALALSPQQAAHARLLRVLEARVVHATGIVEDGSAAQWKPDFRYEDAKGKKHGLRDLVTEFTDVAVDTLGLGAPDQAMERLGELAALEGGDFERLLVAVKLPEKPAYYDENMEFGVEIDRGDVWYDFPYDDEGQKRSQGRKRFPKLTLYTTYEGQRIPIVRWRTTIGSWRTEEHDGQEWFAYKNSDVGERVWKTIMAAPVWIPPGYTPTRTLVKRKYKKGKLRTVVNYDETGPSYTSAYGLVAAYHIKQVTRKDGTVAELDNQIRTHGSVDYMSILRRYSHGCHRLYNMNAVRLFSFVLQHRNYVRHGQTEIGWRKAFDHEGKDFRMAIDTRGYHYELTTPIHVNVAEGRIRGSRTRPYTELMPKPGVLYGEEEDEQEAALGVMGTSTDAEPLPGQ